MVTGRFASRDTKAVKPPGHKARYDGGSSWSSLSLSLTYCFKTCSPLTTVNPYLVSSQ